jgi:hypothetical protein
MGVAFEARDQRTYSIENVHHALGRFTRFACGMTHEAKANASIQVHRLQDCREIR